MLGMIANVAKNWAKNGTFYKRMLKPFFSVSHVCSCNLKFLERFFCLKVRPKV
jgi:hypothetical protein